MLGPSPCSTADPAAGSMHTFGQQDALWRSCWAISAGSGSACGWLRQLGPVAGCAEAMLELLGLTGGTAAVGGQV